MIEIRRTRPEDAPGVVNVAERGFQDSPDMKLWTESDILHHLDVYPEGQFVAVDPRKGRVVGSCTSMRVPLDSALTRHRWRDVTGSGLLDPHKPDGEILYGVDVCVHPRYRMGGVGRLLYDARMNLLRESDCVGFAAGGRIPNYHLFAAHGMPAEEYVRLVEARIIRDPVLGFQLANGMTVLDVIPDYLKDERSGNCASLIYLPHPENPDARDLIPKYRKLPWDPPKPRKRRATQQAERGADGERAP